MIEKGKDNIIEMLFKRALVELLGHGLMVLKPDVRPHYETRPCLNNVDTGHENLRSKLLKFITGDKNPLVKAYVNKKLLWKYDRREDRPSEKYKG